MSEALCEVGLKAIAIMDVLQEHGDAAAAQLNQKYNVAAAFYKVDVRDAQAVNDVITSVRKVNSVYCTLQSYLFVVYADCP